MRILKIVVLGFLLIFGYSAMADFRTIALASEVPLSEFRAPATPNGVTSFKTCESCTQQVISVTHETQYKLSGRFVTLAQFRSALSTVANREIETVIVMHHLESDVVTLISIDL